MESKQVMEPISLKTVVEQIVDRMTNAIMEGHYKLGMKLPSEFELMEELNVSRNSLREAMKIMSAMGIVEIRRGDGTYITKTVNPNIFDSVIYSIMFESSTNDEIVEYRKILDEAVLKVAMYKISEEEIVELQKYIDQMQFYSTQNDYEKVAELDYAFHLRLIDCSKNTFLIRNLKSVYKVFYPTIKKNIRTEEAFARADEHHQIMLEVLKNQDESLIHKAIDDSLSSWKKRVKEKQE